MRRKSNANNKRSKRYKKQSCANDNEASTSTNRCFVTNEFEQSNTEIITSIRSRFMQLTSSHDIDEDISVPFSEDHNLSSIEESNFSILSFSLCFSSSSSITKFI